MRYDVFISHASEDKDSFVRALAHELRKKGLRIWYDEFALKAGDSLRQSIDRGLLESLHGIVVLSPSFFEKEWTQWELDGLVERARREGAGRIIPLWHHVGHAFVVKHSPPIANLVAIPTDQGLDQVVASILDAIGPEGLPLPLGSLDGLAKELPLCWAERDSWRQRQQQLRSELNQLLGTPNAPKHRIEELEGTLRNITEACDYQQRKLEQACGQIVHCVAKDIRDLQDRRQDLADKGFSDDHDEVARCDKEMAELRILDLGIRTLPGPIPDRWLVECMGPWSAVEDALLAAEQKTDEKRRYKEHWDKELAAIKACDEFLERFKRGRNNVFAPMAEDALRWLRARRQRRCGLLGATAGAMRGATVGLLLGATALFTRDAGWCSTVLLLMVAGALAGLLVRLRWGALVGAAGGAIAGATVVMFRIGSLPADMLDRVGRALGFAENPVLMGATVVFGVFGLLAGLAVGIRDAAKKSVGEAVLPGWATRGTEDG